MLISATLIASVCGGYVLTSTIAFILAVKYKKLPEMELPEDILVRPELSDRSKWLLETQKKLKDQNVNLKNLTDYYNNKEMKKCGDLLDSRHDCDDDKCKKYYTKSENVDHIKIFNEKNAWAGAVFIAKNKTEELKKSATKKQITAKKEHFNILLFIGFCWFLYYPYFMIKALSKFIEKTFNKFRDYIWGISLDKIKPKKIEKEQIEVFKESKDYRSLPETCIDDCYL